MDFVRIGLLAPLRVRRPPTFTGSSRAQTTPRRVAALANTPGMSVGRRLARRRLDHAITPATFVATALAPFAVEVSHRRRRVPLARDRAARDQRRQLGRLLGGQ